MNVLLEEGFTLQGFKAHGFWLWRLLGSAASNKRPEQFAARAKTKRSGRLLFCTDMMERDRRHLTFLLGNPSATVSLVW